MENQAPEKKKNVHLVSALIFLVLFILPLGSVYFLNKGMNFNKAVKKELTVKGKVSEFSVANQHNSIIDTNLLNGRVTVVNFFDHNEATAKSQADQINKVHSSFDDTEDVYFLSFLKKDTNRNLLDRSIELGVNDIKQWSVVELDEKRWDNISGDVFQSKEGIVLVDTSLNIRHYYKGYNDSLIGHLVLHISKIIPKQPRRGL